MLITLHLKKDDIVVGEIGNHIEIKTSGPVINLDPEAFEELYQDLTNIRQIRADRKFEERD